MTAELKKARILETAFKLFSTFGFKRVSMDEIARTAGFGKNTVYQFFDSKQTLMLETVDYFSGQLGKAIQSVLESDFPPVEKLRLFIKTVFDGLAPLRSEALGELETDCPEAYHKIQRLRKQLIFENLTKLLNEGKQAGIYDPDTDEALAAHMVIGAVDHISRPEVLKMFDRRPVELFQSVLVLLLKGCLSEPARKNLDKI